MADRSWDEVSVIHALRAAGQDLAAPDTDVVSPALRRIALQPSRRSMPRRLVVVFATLLVASLATGAIAALLVPGVQFRFGDRATPPATDTLDPTVDLGVPMSLEAAAEALDGTAPWVLREPAMGKPQLYRHPQSMVVSVAYPAGPALPELGDSGLGLVLSQFPVRDLPWFEKSLGSAEGVEVVEVAGQLGLWVEGPHDLAFLPDGAAPDHTRLANNVLLWSNDGLTLRMESALDRGEALDLASAVTRADG